MLQFITHVDDRFSCSHFQVQVAREVMGKDKKSRKEKKRRDERAQAAEAERQQRMANQGQGLVPGQNLVPGQLMVTNENMQLVPYTPPPVQLLDCTECLCWVSLPFSQMMIDLKMKNLGLSQ